MSVSFKGYGENVLTFKSILKDKNTLVKINSDSSVSKALADEDFIGITVYADGKYAGVVVDGYVEMKYSGTKPAEGFGALVSDGANAVKSSTTSKHIVRIIKVDSDNGIVGFIL